MIFAIYHQLKYQNKVGCQIIIVNLLYKDKAYQIEGAFGMAFLLVVGSGLVLLNLLSL
jgi:hypothetical protein